MRVVPREPKVVVLSRTLVATRDAARSTVKKGFVAVDMRQARQHSFVVQQMATVSQTRDCDTAGPQEIEVAEVC